MSNEAICKQRRLSTSSLGDLPETTAIPGYDRSPAASGFIHFGPGAFHRSHQAAYIDEYLANHDSGWGISAVSLRSTGTRDRLAEQDFLYSLSILDREPGCRIIGSVFEMLAAKDQQADILSKFECPGIRVASLTITEKGYCLTPSGDLDTSNQDIQHDLMNRDRPVTAIGYLVEGYRRRHRMGMDAFTSLSCDNLVNNGDRLSRAVLQFAGEVDPELALWIKENACFPNSMVDSITPATDERLLSAAQKTLGLCDAAPVQREAFSQWVIEDRFSAQRPQLEEVGVTFTSDVASYEQAKLRILNGLHSTLAYLGLLMGYSTVAEAMRDLSIRAFLVRQVREEVLQGLELDGLDGYLNSILDRFENPAIEYQLLQIAGDSSQKIPFRIMGSVRDNLEAGRPVKNLAVTIAAWLHFCRREINAGVELNDPLNDAIGKCVRQCNGDPENDLQVFSALSSVLSTDLLQAERFRAALKNAYQSIESGQLRGLLDRY